MTAQGNRLANAQPTHLPRESRAWLAEHRLLGFPDEQLAELLIEAGHDTALVRAELGALSSDPCYVVADRMTQRFRKLKSILDVRAAVSRLSHDAAIERRSNVSEFEFVERYYAANRPVVLTGLLARSTALQCWTPEYLAEVCGEATVQIMAGRNVDPRYEVNSEAHKREVKMADYVRMVREAGESNDYYLVANNGFFDRPDVRQLYNEVPALPEYLDPGNASRRIFLWFGPGGTITPLHHDLMNVMVAQIYGQKRFTLIQPEDTPYVYNHIGVYGDVDCRAPDYTRHPLYKLAHPITVTISEGDVLFIPVGWWHHVEALSTSIMVSYTNFKIPNDYEWFHPAIR